MKAVVLNKLGGPEVLEIAEQEKTPPGEGDVLVRVTSAGLNRADTLFRQGRYLQTPDPPSRIGMEAAGVVEEIGGGVENLKVGDRVGTLPGVLDLKNQGGVAEYITVPERILLPTPEKASDEDAGGIWMQYLTAWGALHHAIELRPGQTVVITAASSSVGLAAVEIVNHLGGVAIATTTSAGKVEKIKANGAAHVIDVKNENYTERIEEITEGNGVDVVFDPVAGPAVNDHLKVTKPQGWVFIYGVLDTTPMTVNPGLLLGKNITLRGYTIFPLLTDPEGLALAAKRITDGINNGEFKINVDRRFPMSEAAESHRYMESNQQVGKIVVNP